MARIALDAMGGDRAPRAPVEGALLALAELDAAHRIQLVGQTGVIGQQLDELLAGPCAHLSANRDRLDLIEAPDVIGMNEKPVAAIRSKPNSSMVTGLRMQGAGDSDAFVSAGNTGAQMAASTFALRLHAGLSRPAIATVFPTADRAVVVLDAGANVDCSALELVQFARLGAVYAEDILGRANPGIALLSIGEEPEKGNRAVLEAHRMLRDTDLNFVGNVEGRDVLAGATERGSFDVVVCDGFVGNVMLKFYEAMPRLMAELLMRNGVSEAQLTLALRGFDYSDYGGAPLLGVKGVSIICHGSSSSRAIKNALLVALRAVEARLVEHIGRRLDPAPMETA